MGYPRTDEEWVKLAECVVMKDPVISPEVVGGLSVDATTTIFSWYKGEERRKALVLRQYGRERLIELGKGAGCIPKEYEVEPPWEQPREAVEHGSYVIFTNLDTGETKRYFNIFPPDSPEVVSAAMLIKPSLEERWGKNIKFEIAPVEKLPPGGVSRLFPKTYGDWVDLACSIKERDPSPETVTRVNVSLFNISEKDDDDAKRWLIEKAGELGIT